MGMDLYIESLIGCRFTDINKKVLLEHINSEYPDDPVTLDTLESELIEYEGFGMFEILLNHKRSSVEYIGFNILDYKPGDYHEISKNDLDGVFQKFKKHFKKEAKLIMIARYD